MIFSRGCGRGGGKHGGSTFQAVQAAVQVQVLVLAGLLELLIVVLQLLDLRLQGLQLGTQLVQLVEHVHVGLVVVRLLLKRADAVGQTLALRIGRCGSHEGCRNDH
ncbi:hypothetical protein OEZ77_25960, partial [Leclercia adecarboxylata]